MGTEKQSPGGLRVQPSQSQAEGKHAAEESRPRSGDGNERWDQKHSREDSACSPLAPL